MKVKGVVKQWRFPEASERQLSRSIQEAIRDLVILMRKRTKAMKFDATDNEINSAEDEINSGNKLTAATDLIAGIVSTLPAIALTIYKFNAKQFINVAKSTGGKDNTAVIVLIAIGANANEVVSDWSTNIRNANFRGSNDKQVNDLAEKRFAVYSSWGKTRSENIIGAWNSRLMRQRLYDAKVTHYFWHGMLDDRERLQHVLWEGKRISLDAIHDFHGEPWGCRCWAIPDWNNKGE
ncbi:UNVERIFIED_ASMBLY: putative minor capsid protein [Shigella phage 2019SD1]|uniref:Minor capsid protein n=1 Tax=Shigella phage 2019SD1 TaxID=2848074 RepID=A0A6M5C8Y1_9CAUD|nr:head morphogenesis [Shigella phage 2019SD1]